MKIGVVLAGGANKGAYEIGVVRALAELFLPEDIRYISGSSIGCLSAYALATGKIEELANAWKDITPGHERRFFLKLSANQDALSKIRRFVCDEDSLSSELYFTLWNFSKRQIEYVRVNELPPAERNYYLQAALSFPMFSKGVRIRNSIYLDGAPLDNIPVYPLLEQDLDLVFCVYFENRNFWFESDAFNKKVICLNRFPCQSRLNDMLIYDPAKADSMMELGYRYTHLTVEQLFTSDSLAQIYRNLETARLCEQLAPERRIFTADSWLAAMNDLTKHMTKRKIK